MEETVEAVLYWVLWDCSFFWFSEHCGLSMVLCAPGGCELKHSWRWYSLPTSWTQRQGSPFVLLLGQVATLYSCVWRGKAGSHLALSGQKRIVFTLLLTVSFMHNSNSYSSLSWLLFPNLLLLFPNQAWILMPQDKFQQVTKSCLSLICSS